MKTETLEEKTQRMRKHYLRLQAAQYDLANEIEEMKQQQATRQKVDAPADAVNEK